MQRNIIISRESIYLINLEIRSGSNQKIL